MRLLSRLQFALAARKVTGGPYRPGTESHPQGELFDATHYTDHRSPFLDLDVKESARRRLAGEGNPDAPWKTPFLQHHFQKHPVPEQRELEL